MSLLIQALSCVTNWRESGEIHATMIWCNFIPFSTSVFSLVNALNNRVLQVTPGFIGTCLFEKYLWVYIDKKRVALSGLQDAHTKLWTLSFQECSTGSLGILGMLVEELDLSELWGTAVNLCSVVVDTCKILRGKPHPSWFTKEKYGLWVHVANVTVHGSILSISHAPQMCRGRELRTPKVAENKFGWVTGIALKFWGCCGGADGRRWRSWALWWREKRGSQDMWRDLILYILNDMTKS